MSPTWRAIVLVSQNLVVTLERLLYVDELRVMWIDALCIDQASKTEKSPQVSMIMGSTRNIPGWFGSHCRMWLLLKSSRRPFGEG
ncbi:hypothetical protein GGS26DRAFT_540695 [Hypomontagnella submonticulosa]|nr:hypothetical protein GGS26DRAFT_540695 [Hypomontagnella submonticulosa]